MKPPAGQHWAHKASASSSEAPSPPQTPSCSYYWQKQERAMKQLLSSIHKFLFFPKCQKIIKMNGIVILITKNFFYIIYYIIRVL